MFSFLHGFLLGLALVMPFGPLNVYILSNASLVRSYVAALHITFIAVTCDFILVILSVSGVQLLSTIEQFKIVLEWIGIFFLLYMGVKMWNAQSSVQIKSETSPSLKSHVLSIAALSFFNPLVLLDVFILIGGASVNFVGKDKLLFALGCMVGDLFWFLCLGLTGYFLQRYAYKLKLVSVIYKISSVIMIASAIKLLFWDKK